MNDMNRKCSKNWDEILRLAEGGAAPDLQLHLESCDTCRRTYEQISLVLGRLATVKYAPASLIKRAEGLFAPSSAVRARLVATSLGAAGARGSESLQNVYSFEGVQVRVMYRQRVGGWEVVGQTDDPSWKSLQCEVSDDGRFEFSVSALAEAEMTWYKDQQTVHLGPPEIQG